MTAPVEQELLTLSEHQGSPPVFSGVRVNQSLVLCACFVDRFVHLEEEFKDTKLVIKICISKKNRQHNGQKK
jgi:hypothetical protein